MSTSTREAPSRALTGLALAALVGMAMLWGSTFFATKDLLHQMSAASFLSVRFVIAASATALLGHRHLRMGRETLRRGALLGLLYGIAQLVQTWGLGRTSASATGFITGLYVVLTPFLAARIMRRRVPRATWLAVVLAACGLGVMTLDLHSGFHAGLGELAVLAGAVLYAVHIVCVDAWSDGENAIGLTIVQLVVVAIVCTLAALPQGITLPRDSPTWWWMLYLALAAGALPIFLQVWAQGIVEPTTAAVLMAGEPVWAAVFAVIFGGELLTWQMFTGGGSIFAAMILVTLLPRILESRRADAP